jgi:ankyrin repeat protein
MGILEKLGLRNPELHRAVSANDRDAVIRLIEAGADVNAASSRRMTALHCAVNADSVDICEVLLDHHAAVDATNAAGETPLYLAVRRRKVETVRGLLDRKANIDVPNSAGETPLYLAASLGLREIFCELLSRGANVKAKTGKGATMIWAALLFQELNQNAAPTVVLEMVSKLVERGADANENLLGNGKGVKPIHGAALLGHRDLAEFLVTNGADVDARAYGNVSPLLTAVVARKMSTVDFFLHHKVDVNIRSPDGHSLLTIAKAKSLVQIVQLLEAAGARA